MEDKELQEALENLANYVAERLPDGWMDTMLEIEFVADDVVKMHGAYRSETGETAGLALDYEVVALTDSIRDAVGQLHQDEVKGLHLSLGADGVLSVEFTYADDV